MIIQSNSFLGFNFYKRQRLSKKKLIFTLSEIQCDDIGLYIIGKYPNLEYNFVSLFQKKQWNDIALETINLTIINLVISGIIDIYKFEDEKGYFSKLIKRKTKGYYFKIINTYYDHDILSKAIITSINNIESSEIKVKDFSKVIHNLLDSYLGHNLEHYRPEKKFIIEMLNSYSKKHDWLNIVSTKKMLGLYKDYKVELNKIYIPRINMQHQDLINYHSQELKNNPDCAMFRNMLRKVLIKDFKKRIPQDDNVD